MYIRRRPKQDAGLDITPVYSMFQKKSFWKTQKQY